MKTAAIILVVIFIGRLATRPLLRIVAKTRLREIFTAFALLLIIAMSVLMQKLGLSMGLGAFMAGVLLADSEYRHALETDIEPFKGLLLGLFFISVGMSIDVGSVSAHPFAIVALVLAIMTTKFGIHYGLGHANGISATVLDHEPDQIELLRRFGFKIYYGDATREDLLIAAGARDAKILVVAIDNPDDCLKLVDLAQKEFPHLKIYARARNVQHVYQLLDRKIEAFERETFEASLTLGRHVLKGLGWPSHPAWIAANTFRDHNNQILSEMSSVRTNQEQLVAKVKQARTDLEKMFEREKQRRENSQAGWD